jgi:serine phosphatase RsbU (regulator of sigma subunit)
MEVQIAVAKVNKYATSSSGDTVEVVERPHGGLSVVLADGQSSGRGAKTVSTMVVRKVITLLAEGVRDGAAARAASDSLYTEKHGKVSATLNILSVDMHTRSLVITRNNPAPVILANSGQLQILDAYSQPIGLYRDTRPVIDQIPLTLGLVALTFSDGLIHAGSRTGHHLDIPQAIKEMTETQYPDPQTIADELLRCAVGLDQNRPVDDISIVVLAVGPGREDQARRMIVSLPLE